MRSFIGDSLLLAVALVLLVQATSALKCFHCHNCEEETAQLRDCPDDTQCYSVLGPVTRRGCAYSCPFQSEYNKEECHMCADDMCNHHTQESTHFLRKAIHHRHRHHKRALRDRRENSAVVSTRFLADGTRVETYKELGEELPPIPDPEQDEETQAETEFREKLLRDEEIKKKYIAQLAAEHEAERRKTEPAAVEPPMEIKVTEKETVLPDGQIVKEIVTDTELVPISDMLPEDADSVTVLEQLNKEAAGHQEKKSEEAMNIEAAGVLSLPKPRVTKEELQEVEEEPLVPIEIKRDMTPEELRELEKKISETYGWTDDEEDDDEEYDETDGDQKEEKTPEDVKEVDEEQKKTEEAKEPHSIGEGAEPVAATSTSRTPHGRPSAADSLMRASLISTAVAFVLLMI